MDFGALPPEVNSGRMYTGPGSTPMVSAASAWNRLASELSFTADGYERVIKALSGEEWFGPASAMMLEAITPLCDVDALHRGASRTGGQAGRSRGRRV